MSENNFYGQPLNTGKNYFQIEICEVCLQKTPGWVEILGDKINGFSIRMTCDKCHDEFENVSNVNANIIEADDINVKTDNNMRPGWIDEFIQSSDSIENISTIDEPDESVEIKENWIKEFIDETLFGTNPVNWLESNNLFHESVVTNTIILLKELSTNESSNVKITAIEGLFRIYSLNKEHKDLIIQSLQVYQSDSNELIEQLAIDTLKRMK